MSIRWEPCGCAFDYHRMKVLGFFDRHREILVSLIQQIENNLASQERRLRARWGPLWQVARWWERVGVRFRWPGWEERLR
ncbi:MAG: hypothetical protein ACREKK_01415 [Candidatus Methylomirabilales bacterium]